MAQPETAVGGAPDEPVIAAEPTLEDRFSSILSDDEPDAPPAEDTEEADPPIVDEVQGDEDAAEPVEAAEEIAPPNSWSAEDKAIFGQLPPDAQKIIARRETERDNFLLRKSEEVRHIQQTVQTQTVEQLGQLQATYAQQLSALIPHVPEEPSAHLLAQDPYAYAAQLEGHKQATAQRNAIVAQLQQIAQQQQAITQQVTVQERQATIQALQEAFPEFIAPETGPELQRTLGSTAAAMGYAPQQIAEATAQDILAMKRAHEWKTKADKYDAMVAKQMEGVRAAKKLPSVSRPGAAQPTGARANERYVNDRKAMKQGDKDAAARVFSRFL